MDPENDDIVRLARWQRTHDPVDFEWLHQAFFGLVEKEIAHYPPAIHDQLRIPALGIFIQALLAYEDRGVQTPATHILYWMRRLGRVAGHILHPGIPESRWPRTPKES